MGHGIAQVAAAAGYQVILRDVDDQSLARGRQAIERNLAKGVQLGKVSEADRAQTLAQIKTTTRLPDLAAADLIIEAVPENLELKQKLLRECAAVLKSDYILAYRDCARCRGSGESRWHALFQSRAYHAAGRTRRR